MRHSGQDHTADSPVQSGVKTNLVIMARAPVTGRCKTRLARTMGAQRAAAMHQAMVETVVASARAASQGHIILACTPSIRHAFFARLARRYGLQRVSQPQGELGTRMLASLRATGPSPAAHILLGTDQPNHVANLLGQGIEALQQGKNSAWLAPTLDGGFWALGVQNIDARLFHVSRWSCNRVKYAVRRNLHRSGQVITNAIAMHDIDTSRDWHQLPRLTRQILARRATMPGYRQGNPRGTSCWSHEPH